jgi:AcrR family transcriptional regulator
MNMGTRNQEVKQGRQARPYTQRKRAEAREATRRRIVEAAVDLHTSIGPARTSVSAIAVRAGVQRLTYYRHFPVESELLWACSRHYLAENPPPDPAGWLRTASPPGRLHRALREVFRYYARTEQRWVLVRRDALIRPDLRQYGAPYAETWRKMRSALLTGWGPGGRRRSLLGAAIGVALDFSTWQLLVRQEGLGESQAVGLLSALVAHAAAGK